MRKGLLAAVAVGVTAVAWYVATPEARTVSTSLPELPASTKQDPEGARTLAVLHRQVERLQRALAAETAERTRLAARLDEMAVRLGGLGGDVAGSASQTSAASPSRDTGLHAPIEASPARGEAPPPDAATSEFERALLSAGLDPATAADIKRRRDDQTMAEMYLRDQATREQWLDTPRFHEEMVALEAQRTSMRDELGDDGYDRYLAARGEPNRVRVEEVLTASPAAQAGLQSGDFVLRYGETRIFAPDELVAQTRAGTAGELVRVEVIRQGQRLEIDVPRGPLGLRVAASQANPDA